jgi:hypothetical protein
MREAELLVSSMRSSQPEVVERLAIKMEWSLIHPYQIGDTLSL